MPSPRKRSAPPKEAQSYRHPEAGSIEPQGDQLLVVKKLEEARYGDRLARLPIRRKSVPREEQAFRDRRVQPPPHGVASKPTSALREEPPPYGGPPITKAPEGHRSPMGHENPIEEIWRIRDQIAAECGYDVSRLFARLREEEAKYKDRLVSFVPRKTAKPVRKKRHAAGK